MPPETREQAWIRGLPGWDAADGVPVEVLALAAPKPEARAWNLTLYAPGDLIASLQALARDHTIIPALSLVVRTDAATGADEQYSISGAVISAAAPLPDSDGAQVNIRYDGLLVRRGRNLNPGPPDGCPVIQRAGVNTGWIHYSATSPAGAGISVEVLDFDLPLFQRKLIVALGEPSGEVRRLAGSSLPVPELILVLPDRSWRRYVELNLWNAKVTPAEQSVVFESDLIEYLMGEATPAM